LGVLDKRPLIPDPKI